MRVAHRHDDIEVNVALAGTLIYVLGGRIVTLPAGSTALFWAAVPHQLLGVGDGAVVHWLTVPLGTVLGFGLPERSLGALLCGDPLTLVGADPAGLPVSWPPDLTGVEPDLRAAALLEVHAWLRRRVWAVRQAEDSGDLRSEVERMLPRDVRTATAIARDVAVHFREPLTIAAIAARANVSPGHAMTVFRRVVGATLGVYLVQCRVAEAQRLLVTTDATVTEIGFRAGFTSQSAFYAAFTASCHEAPGADRGRLRAGIGASSDL